MLWLATDDDVDTWSSSDVILTLDGVYDLYGNQYSGEQNVDDQTVGRHLEQKRIEKRFGTPKVGKKKKKLVMTMERNWTIPTQDEVNAMVQTAKNEALPATVQASFHLGPPQRRRFPPTRLPTPSPVPNPTPNPPVVSQQQPQPGPTPTVSVPPPTAAPAGLIKRCRQTASKFLSAGFFWL